MKFAVTSYKYIKLENFLDLQAARVRTKSKPGKTSSHCIVQTNCSAVTDVNSQLYSSSSTDTRCCPLTNFNKFKKMWLNSWIFPKFEQLRTLNIWCNLLVVTCHPQQQPMTSHHPRCLIVCSKHASNEANQRWVVGIGYSHRYRHTLKIAVPVVLIAAQYNWIHKVRRLKVKRYFSDHFFH